MSDFYEIETAATEEPLLVDEAKVYLKVETLDDSGLVDALISTVTSQGEKFTNRVFVERTITGKFSQLETSEFERYPFITIRRAPVSAINSVKVVLDDVLTDVPSTDYQFKESSGFPRILFTDTISCDDVPYPLEVEFVAGYGDANAVPADILVALKEHIAFMYENRGDVAPDGDLPMPVITRSIYRKYRIVNTYG
jgi:uncharacterized phiE125 gp8 family phage protein